VEVFRHSSIRIYGVKYVQGDIFFVSTTLHFTACHSGVGIFIRPSLDSGTRKKRKEIIVSEFFRMSIVSLAGRVGVRSAM
jgi:hypothetical protein